MTWIRINRIKSNKFKADERLSNNILLLNLYLNLPREGRHKITKNNQTILAIDSLQCYLKFNLQTTKHFAKRSDYQMIIDDNGIECKSKDIEGIKIWKYLL